MTDLHLIGKRSLQRPLAPSTRFTRDHCASRHSDSMAAWVCSSALSTSDSSPCPPSRTGSRFLATCLVGRAAPEPIWRACHYWGSACCCFGTVARGARRWSREGLSDGLKSKPAPRRHSIVFSTLYRLSSCLYSPPSNSHPETLSWV